MVRFALRFVLAFGRTDSVPDSGHRVWWPGVLLAQACITNFPMRPPFFTLGLNIGHRLGRGQDGEGWRRAPVQAFPHPPPGHLLSEFPDLCFNRHYGYGLDPSFDRCLVTQ